MRLTRRAVAAFVLAAATVATVTTGATVVRAQPAQALRVCADPDYMPYSNRAGDGFENKLAQQVGRTLQRPSPIPGHRCAARADSISSCTTR